ncbi:hypothetical protein D9611_006035 [Ephemerocybe angulata]|uniref:Fungal-type protein kinase domain-containing protein n=1 Tax=Ephemerocybe angulata TaxID=980116 RepID=A0A8H5CHM7_9AGAR|nr:hypothetical protein D9611_006035 [Tulosesus angulatus]
MPAQIFRHTRSRVKASQGVPSDEAPPSAAASDTPDPALLSLIQEDSASRRTTSDVNGPHGVRPEPGSSGRTTGRVAGTSKSNIRARRSARSSTSAATGATFTPTPTTLRATREATSTDQAIKAAQSEPLAALRTPTLNKVSVDFSASQKYGSTPVTIQTTQNPLKPDVSVDNLQQAVVDELGGKESIYHVDETWATSLYHHMASDSDIALFLDKKDSGYEKIGKSKPRWTGIKPKMKKEGELYTPLNIILSRILKEFLPSDASSTTTRTAVATHKTPFQSKDYTHKTFPDIAILATGPSFEIPDISKQFKKGIGYTNVASVFDAKLDREKGRDEDQVGQMGVYCRQIFIQQPNRNFVRCLIITEKHVRVIHFDRSGVYITPFIDIHENPATFIRLVLGLSSLNEADVGLDTRVQWSINPVTGKKNGGSITVENEGKEVTYTMSMKDAPFVRASIRGRGTVCWPATDSNGKRVLIKDAWRTSDRKSESVYLNAAKGMDGIAQMLLFQDNYAETKNYRPEGFIAPTFFNRIKLRVVLEHYGHMLCNFKTRFELMSSLRDAIVEHRKLFRKGVLHRDISLQNILFGLEDAPEGRRGIIIDLDMAIWTNRAKDEIGKDPRTGAHFYHSVALLLGQDPYYQPAPAQDYLDDLESFFYVLCHIVCAFKGPHQPKPLPSVVEDFKLLSPRTAAAHKRTFLEDGFQPSLYCVQYWGPAIKALMAGYQAFLCKIVTEKAKIRSEEGNLDGRSARIGEMHACAEQHYNEIDALFQNALATLEGERVETILSPGNGPFEDPASPMAASVIRRRRVKAKEKEKVKKRAPSSDPAAGVKVRRKAASRLDTVGEEP